MDGNGNNSSKVSTLRQHFENYDKVEQRKSSLVAATIFPTISAAASTTANAKLVRKHKASSTDFFNADKEAKTPDNNSENSKAASKGKSTNLDVKSFAHGLVDHEESSSKKDLLMSASVAAATAEAASRRNGIYLNNSLRIDENETSQQQNKRRGLVILDDDDVVTVHRCPPEVCVGEDYIDDEDDGMDEDIDDLEHDDDPSVETSIPIAFDRQDEMHGDGSSVTSHSTTSSRHSFHGYISSAKSCHSQTMLGNVNDSSATRNVTMAERDSHKSEKAYLPNPSQHNSSGAGESKANTPTSSSSCSSGSGGCGKVKRRNAFRHKDVGTFPTAAAAGDGSSSAILIAVSKTKVAVERVKSLDSANTNVTSSPCIPSTATDPSVSMKNSSSMNSAVANSTKKSVSSRAFVSHSPKACREKGSMNDTGSDIMNDMNCSSENNESSKCLSSISGSNPHELLANKNNFRNNNGSKGSPAQRAASLCVRLSNNSNNDNNNSPGTKCGNSAFARNNGNGSSNNRSPLLHHPNSSNNNHVNTPADNLPNNGINQQNGSSQRVVNVVTPYQVTDIYNQLKMNDTSLPSYANSPGASTNSKHQMKQIPTEVEYAVPMIQNQPKVFQQTHQQKSRSSQKVPPSEIPPKVPPPPLNYPPSSIRKEQFGLPSPTSSYTFLPHRNPQGMLKPSTSTTSSSAFKHNSSNNSTTQFSPSPTVKAKEIKKSAPGPPEKPPRTFRYNQAAGPQPHPQRQLLQSRQQGTKQPSVKGQHAKQSTKTGGRNQNSSDLYVAVTKTSKGNDSAIGLPMVSQTKRQHSSSSSSSTLTSGTVVNNYRQQMSPSSSSSSSLKKLESSPSSTSVSTATVRQTSTVANMNTPSTQRKSIETMDSGESMYATRMKRRTDENVSAARGTPSDHSLSSAVPSLLQSNYSNSNSNKNHYNHHRHHHHIHPPLVRSKTESQLVVKNKNNPSRLLNRPSDVTVNYGVEMMSLEAGHYPQDSTASNAFSQPGVMTVSSYYAANGPPVHHQSQTNLLNLTSHKIYEQQQYRSINNLLRYSSNSQSGSSYYNKYPSNPGLYYASRESSWLDNGLPPVSTMCGSGGSSYNLYSGGDNRQSNQNTRHNSLLYTTNIDISCGEQQADLHGGSGRPASTFKDSSNAKHSLDLHQQQQQSGNLYGMKASDSQSVHHQFHASSRFNNQYVHHPLYQYKLSERSKSEWALNAVQCGVEPSGTVHRLHRQQQQVSNSPNSNNNPGGVSSSSTISNQCPPLPPQMMGRRATVAISGASTSGSHLDGAPGNTSGTGHASLDSPVSSHNTSNNSSLQHSNNATKTQRHHVPNSIQHLVNQLFSASNIKDATSSTDSGIQLGSESLSSCDTPIGDSTTDTGDSDCENEGDLSNTARKVVEARKGYVRRVSSVRVQELGESLHRLIQSSKIPHNVDPLFECLLVVGLDRDPTNGIYHPYIREKFPRDAKLAEGVEQFCFPDSLEWPCHEGSTAQFYTLAITDQRGGRKFGCCFRILPEGANFCIPITYCIISSHRAIGFYREVLREITSCHGHSEYQRRHFLQELYKKSFPPPGSSISVTEPTIEETYMQSENVGYGITGSPPKSVTIRRRVDQRLDEGDLVTLVSTVDLSIVIKLFGSLLLERKVVLLSRALSTLSLCVEALESLLYPFNWQHTFVPILPLDMTDVIDAPAPFLIGVLRSSRTAWDKTLDDGIVVDLDVENGKIISCVGDEGTILPKRIHRKLRNALSQLVLDLADQKESTKNVLISECFIRMFVETLGHYSNHIITKPDGTRVFERESFVKSVESKATQNFLEWFSETSMFNEFCELKLKNSQQHGLFEQRVMEQIESGPIVHGSGSSGTPLKKDIWIKMKGGPFGTWLKETFK